MSHLLYFSLVSFVFFIGFVCYICFIHFFVIELEERDAAGEINPLFSFGRKFCEHLSHGLADSWSQVIFFCDLTVVYMSCVNH